MMRIDPNAIKVKYYDHLGFEHDGIVALTMPTNNPDIPDDVHYCFVIDEDPQFNDKTYRAPDGSMQIIYAEIRRSDELIRVGEW